MSLTLPVREILPATPRARIVRLDLDGRTFPYQPGQGVFVRPHGESQRWAFSLAGAPSDARADGCLELLVALDRAGQFGAALATTGARLDVEGPIGDFTFPTAPAVHRFIFIAGGTGIAPVRSMLRHALQIPHREIVLLYSARTPDEFAYHGELQSLAEAGRIDMRQTITRSLDAGLWTGRRGRIGHDELATIVHDPTALCFICGPKALVEDTTRSLEELGMPRDRIRLEEWYRRQRAASSRPVPLMTESRQEIPQLR